MTSSASGRGEPSSRGPTGWRAVAAGGGGGGRGGENAPGAVGRRPPQVGVAQLARELGLGQHPAAFLGDADGNDVVLVAVESPQDRGGGDERNFMLARAPSEQHAHAALRHRSSSYHHWLGEGAGQSAVTWPALASGKFKVTRRFFSFAPFSGATGSPLPLPMTVSPRGASSSWRFSGARRTWA